MFRLLCCVVLFFVFGLFVMYRFGMLIVLVGCVIFISEFSIVVGVFFVWFDELWLCVLKLM